MTKPNAAGAEVVRRRKATVWTRKKIGQLIDLYRQHDCLWNHYTEAYKNKDCRSKAIDDICGSLRITKLDFGRKIHNLRSQFNSEMKKLERRIEETGGGTAVSTDTAGCRWKHFESLRFLRDVIEPRPSGYQVGGNLPQAKQRRVGSRLKLDYGSEEDVEQHTNTASSGSRNADVEDVTEYHFEETTTVGDDEPLVGDQVETDGFQQYETVEGRTPNPDGTEIYDRKYNPRISSIEDQIVSIANLTSAQPACSSKTYLTRMQQHKPHQHQQRSETIHLNDTQPLSTAIVELVTTGSTARVAQLSSPACPPSSKQPENTAIEFKARDQWDAFGELIASEFRHLTSDQSRKKLKRKIMQAMLEVGEEDDSVAV